MPTKTLLDKLFPDTPVALTRIDGHAALCNQAALDQMVESLVMGGKIALLGIPPGKSPVDWSRIVFKAITIKGVYGREMFETWYKMIAMLENGLDVSRVITHEFAVDQFKDGFEAMLSGRSGKVVLNWA